MGTVALTEVDVVLSTNSLSTVNTGSFNSEYGAGKHGFGFMLVPLPPNKKIKSNKRGPKGVEMGSHDCFVLYAESDDERRRWMSRLKCSIVCTGASTSGRPMSLYIKASVIVTESDSDSDQDIPNGFSDIKQSTLPLQSDDSFLPNQTHEATAMSTEEVSKWLTQQHLAHLRDKFISQSIDGSGLCWLHDLADRDMRSFLALAEQQLGITRISDAMKFIAALQHLFLV